LGYTHSYDIVFIKSTNNNEDDDPYYNSSSNKDTPVDKGKRKATDSDSEFDGGFPEGKKLDKGKGKALDTDVEDQYYSKLNDNDDQILKDLEYKHRNLKSTGDVFADAENRYMKIKGDLEVAIILKSSKDEETPEDQEELDSMRNIYNHIEKQRAARMAEVTQMKKEEAESGNNDSDSEEDFDPNQFEDLTDDEKKVHQDLDKLEDELLTKYELLRNG
jgi:hypothetical protein